MWKKIRWIQGEGKLQLKAEVLILDSVEGGVLGLLLRPQSLSLTPEVFP